jgi:hypothetical protein
MKQDNKKEKNSSEKLDELIKKKKVETSALKKILDFHTNKESKGKNK